LTSLSDDKEHVPVFVHFLKPKTFSLLIAGGVLYALFNLYFAFLTSSNLDILNGVLILILFVPVALFLRLEADRLLVKRVDEIFSEGKSKVKDLFKSDRDFSLFAKKSKGMIRSSKEYYFIIAFLIFLFIMNPTTQDIVRGKANEIMQNALAIDSIYKFYYSIYFGLFVAIIIASIIYSIIGFIAIMVSINKEKYTLKITKSIEEFKKALSLLKTKGKAETGFDFIDLSFGELKEALTPLQKLGYDLAVSCATFGLAFSTPGIIYFFITHDLSNMVYFGLIVFVAFLSLSILVATEFGIGRVWTSSKSEATSVLEQLCDRVKLRCVKSICTLEDFQSRENSVKDVAFVRSTISDLREIRTSDFTARTVAQIITTLVLPYIPLVLKILGLY